ncbi:MAG: hypothetical protein ACOCUV_01340 [bacterium]
MLKKFKLLALVLVVQLLAMLFFVSCKQKTNNYVIYEEEPFPYLEDIVEKDTATKAIFYYMSLPVEMAKMFEKAGAVYDPAILNPVENVKEYESSSKIALNLGVYGVDLNYSRLFQQNQLSLQYMANIHELSTKLGLPQEYFMGISKKFEDNLDNKDSLYLVAKEIFINIDNHLKKSDRGDAAAFIMLGGWIESLYISARIYQENPHNVRIKERILQQKYTLNTLVSFLYNFESDIVISKYIIMLKMLKKLYDDVYIYTNENIKVDTLKKELKGPDIKYEFSDQTVNDITDFIINMRNVIIH